MPQIVAAIGSIGSAFAATSVGSFLTTTFIGKLLTSVALSALQRALMSKPSAPAPGIKTSATQAGGTNPGQFILGRYATGGYASAPAMSHGTVAGVKDNAFLTYVIEVSDIPVQGLAGLVIDGTVAEIGTTPHADYGLPILGDFDGKAWVKFYTGTQTAADPMLLAKYGDYPERPWTADMIGTGLAYAILTFQYDREIFNSLPTVRIIADGIKLYDPRKDTTAGGSGAHRWANPATWEFTQNPAVQIYNIMRGITLPDGNIWGGRFGASDLPFTNWAAAMNACDVTVTEGGASVPKFRAGLEVSLTDEPAKVIEELLSACLGQMVDMGGVWKIRVGGPGLPVLFFDDEDVMVSRPEDYDPFPAVTETYNGITATYPEPRALWEPKEAAPIYRTDWETEDGERLVANLQFAAVTSHRQVRHIMRSTLRDHRRMARHNNTLGPFSMGLEPLDVAAWTSARNGYTEKAFEAGQVVDDLGGLPVLQVAIREVDGSDFDNSEFDDVTISLPPGKVIRPVPRPVVDFAATPYVIEDDNGKPRRPGLLLTWNTAAVSDLSGIEWEVRLNGTTVTVDEGSMRNVSAGRKVISSGIVNSKVYQARARFVTDRKRVWADWVTVTAPDVRLGGDDFDDEVNTSEGGNVFPDFEMTRRLFWNSGSAFTFVGTSIAKMGRNFIEIAPAGVGRNVYSNWFRVDPDAEYRAEAGAWMAGATAGSGTVNVYLQTATMDAAGVVDEAGLVEVLVHTRTDAVYNATGAHGSAVVTPRTDGRAARFRIQRTAGGTSAARAGGFRLLRRVKTGFVGAAQITTETIKENAVTIPVNSYAGGNVNITSSAFPAQFSTATIAREAGFQTKIEVSFLLRPADGTADGDFATVNIQVRRETPPGDVSPDLIMDFEASARALTTPFGMVTSPITFEFWDTDTAGGDSKYTVDAKKATAGGINAVVSKRTLSVEQKKR